jgi:YD repeat-containing protein
MVKIIGELKMKKYIIFLLVSLSILCCEAGNSKSCKLIKMVIGPGQEFNFSYEGNQISGMSIKIGDRERKVSYAYREDGKLLALSTERGKVEYVYDEKGLLTNITSEIIHSSSFDYDSNGKITGLKMGAKYFDYTYTNGNPTKVLIKDTKGDVLEEVNIGYDKKPNVLSGVGPLGNAYELMYGYPVGNAENNIVSIKTIYKKDTKWKINGELRKAGDTLEMKSIHEYDQYGNISSTKEEGSATRSTFQYSCD